MSIKQFLFFPLRIFYDKFFNPIYKKNLARIISQICPNDSSVLDFGCHDGSTALLITQFNPTLNIVGVDIQNKFPALIPKKIYDGKILPYPDNSFDVVMALDVLHHTTDISKHLKELKRVSKKHILIKDHKARGAPSRWLLSFTDYISNAPYGIANTFNFLTQEEWEEMFNKQNLIIQKQPQELDFGLGINEKYNVVFLLNKQR